MRFRTAGPGASAQRIIKIVLPVHIVHVRSPCPVTRAPFWALTGEGIRYELPVHQVFRTVHRNVGSSIGEFRRSEGGIDIEPSITLPVVKYVRIGTVGPEDRVLVSCSRSLRASGTARYCEQGKACRNKDSADRLHNLMWFYRNIIKNGRRSKQRPLN